MKQRLYAILPWIIFPLVCFLWCLGFECLVNGVDLGIQQQGDCIRVSVTNNTFWYARFEWSNTLESNDWHHYKTLFGEPDEPAANNISFLVKTNVPRVFWRLKDSPLP